MVDRCTRTIGDVVEQFGVSVDKVIGDALMAVFGARSHTRTTLLAPCGRVSDTNDGHRRGPRTFAASAYEWASTR